MNDIEENKNYVTHYAFKVNDSLLGKALASPTRRLLSLLVDLLVVGSLTFMSATVMAVCVFIVSVVGLIKSRKKDIGDATKSFVPRILIVAMVISAIVVGASLLSFDSEPDASTITSVAEQQVDSAPQSDQDVSTEQKLDIVTWLQDALINFGSGFGWAAIYFSVFTAWFRGQTVGKLLFRIRVLKIDGKELSLWESFERYGGYSAGLATGLLGFLQVIWDPNRQAIHDKIAETVVLDLTKADRVL
jgi:uncharacterized RDD family membrane protein YckC